MKNRIALISYAHDSKSAEQFNRMIAGLVIPNDIDLEVYLIENIDNAAAAFNQGMHAAVDEEIKLYLEEGVEILSGDLLSDGLKYFEEHSDVSMLGVTGTDQVHSDGISYIGVHRINDLLLSNEVYLPGTDGVDVNTSPRLLLDGGTYFTTKDIEWRGDLFETGYFLGPSQSIEYRRKGHKVGVIKSNQAYIRYNDDIMDIPEAERRIFLCEYSKDTLPLVSIVIPSSRPSFLQKSLPSVLEQDYHNIEVFISDDAVSYDGERYVKEVAATDDRVIYEHHPGFNVTENFDTCMAYNNPQAEYVNWLMDDDVFFSGKISRMVDVFLDNEDVTLVSSKRYVIDADGNILGIMGDQTISSDMKIKGHDAAMSVLNLNNFIGEPTTAMVRKSAMLNGHELGYEGMDHYLRSIYPDGSTWLKVLESGNLVYLMEPYSGFRQHEDHASANLSILLVLLCGQGDSIIHYMGKGKYLDDKDTVLKVYCNYINKISCYIQEAVSEKIETENIEYALIKISEITQLILQETAKSQVVR